MAEKQELAFPDKSVMPGDELVFRVIGGRKSYWEKIMTTVTGKYKAEASWNYYNDGKQWLLKMVVKKKTLFWGAVLATGEFRITFYFADKAEPLIFGSSLPQKVKEDFSTSKKYGAIRPATILVNSDGDVESVLTLAEIRFNLK